MSVICQNVGLLTTTVIRTVVTVFVSTVSLSQDVGQPSSSYVAVPSISCSTSVSANVTRSSCSTSYSSQLTMIPPPSPTQSQYPTTITSQYHQTLFNTIVGSSCSTVTPQPQPTPTQSPTTPPTTPTTAPPTTTPPTTTPPTIPPLTTTPRTTPPAGITDTTYTTEFVTVTGTAPAATTTTTTSILTSSTPQPTGTSAMSQNTVYHGTGTDIPSDTAVGVVASSTSSPDNVPIGAIAGGVVGGVVLIVALGVLAYFLIFKQQPVFAPKGYDGPEGQYAAQSSPQSQDGSGNAQSGLHPQMQDQGSTGASDSMQYSDYAPSQGQPQGFNPYANFPGTQPWQNMAAVGALLPAGAAAGVVVARSPHSSDSSSASPASHTSSALLLGNGSRHQSSQGPFLVPYRGYAEPGDT